MKAKDHTKGLYAYLNAIGVLEHGSPLDIENAKREYWKRYRNEWKKDKRKQSLSYTIFFSTSEANRLQARAKAVKLSPTSYLKHAGLSNGMGKVLRGEIREILIIEISKIETLLGTISIADRDAELILKMMVGIEYSILNKL